MLTVEPWTPAPDSVLIAGGPHGRLAVEAFQPGPEWPLHPRRGRRRWSSPGRRCAAAVPRASHFFLMEVLMPEALMLQLLKKAERWGRAAGTVAAA